MGFILFSVLAIYVFGAIVLGALKVTWTMTKVIFGLIFPLLLVGALLVGLIRVLLPVFAIIGILYVVGRLGNAKVHSS